MYKDVNQAFETYTSGIVKMYCICVMCARVFILRRRVSCSSDFDLKISAGLLQRKSSRPFGNLIYIRYQ